MILFELLEKNENELDLLDTHSECTKNISLLLNELDLNNIYEKFYCYCYLLWNGYFSINHEYFYATQNIVDEHNTIFLGRGCCRHNSQLLSEVLREERIKSRPLGVRTLKIKLKDRIGLETKEEYEVVSKRKYSSNKYLNHSVSLISNDDNLFLLDPTNLMICEVLKNARLKSFNGIYQIDRNMLIDELRRLYIDIPTHRHKSVSKEEILDSYEKVQQICEESQHLFNDFYINNHNNYEKIKQLTMERRSY